MQDLGTRMKVPDISSFIIIIRESLERIVSDYGVIKYQLRILKQFKKVRSYTKQIRFCS